MKNQKLIKTTIVTYLILVVYSLLTYLTIFYYDKNAHVCEQIALIIFYQVLFGYLGGNLILKVEKWKGINKLFFHSVCLTFPLSHIFKNVEFKD